MRFGVFHDLIALIGPETERIISLDTAKRRVSRSNIIRNTRTSITPTVSDTDE